MSKVLVVDDTDTYRRYSKLALEDEGHTVEIASCGSEAIDTAGSFGPDVLVVDWMLDDEYNGLDVARVLAARLPDLETVLISGYPSAHLRRAALEANIRFMKKPFTLEKLVETVSQAARRKDRPDPS